jgi:predicted negative regulator of RcsB-dependent stress response
MTGQKQVEHSLKKPDSFQDHVMKGIQSLVNNKTRLFMFLAPVIVVALAFYAVQSWTNHKTEARRAELAKILAIQTDEQSDVGKRREEIQKEIDAIRADRKTDAKGKKAELSADQLAKVTELEKKISSLKPDNSKSLEAFKKFYDSNKDKPEGWMAGLAWAAGQLQNDKTADARPIVESISKASGSNKFYQLTSRFMLIGILEDAAEYDAGIKECDTLSTIATDESKPAVLLAKGRLQYFKKAMPEARTVLNELIEKHGSTPEATKARGMIAMMGPS